MSGTFFFLVWAQRPPQRRKCRGVEHNLRVEAFGSSYFDISYFLQCFYSVLVAKNHHWSRFLVDEYSFTYIF